MLDIKITNAKTRKTGKELVEIGIENGKITAIAPSVEGEAKQVIDAKGKLVTESFVNGHLHLCKVYTLEMAGQDALKEYNDNNMGGAMTSIERAADFKACYDEKWIIENVRKACDLAVKYGNERNGIAFVNELYSCLCLVASNIQFFCQCFNNIH